MLYEDLPRLSDLPEGSNSDERREKQELKSCDSVANILHNRMVYERELTELSATISSLYGPEPAYEECAEDRASFAEKFHYGWIRPTINMAAEERLDKSGVPPPTAEARGWSCGLRLSGAIQDALAVRNSWNVLIGSEVTLVGDAESRGTLRWVGVPQQGGYKTMMAAVEWTSIPGARTAAHLEDAAHSPIFNGVVHGEKLFEPMKADCSTLEETTNLHLLLARPDSELGSTIPTPTRPSFTRRLFGALPYYFYIQFPFKAVGDVCTLTIPLLLAWFVDFISDDTPTLFYGILLVATLFVVQLIQSCSLHHFYFVSIKGGLQYKTAMTAAIFEKCFTIASKSLAKPEMNSGRIINMVSTDVEMINQFIQYCMYLWSSPLIFIISIFLLARLVGWCSLMAVVAMAATLPINTYNMKQMVKAREMLVKATDMRVKAANEFFSGIRIAKFMTWEPRFIINIELKRKDEIYFLKKVQNCRVLMSFIGVATPMIMIAAVFVIYSITGHELSAKVVFPTISLLGVIRMPFMMIPFVLSGAVQFGVAMQRISSFLECENAHCDTVEDIERVYESGSGSASYCNSAAVLENVDITAFLPVKLPFAPKMVTSWISKALKMMCCCPSCSKAKHPAPALEEDPPSSSSPVTSNGPKGKPVFEKDAFYQLRPKLLLNNVNLSIPKGKLTVVVGATGSGKSTLLQALLGQLEVTKGRVWATKSIAYVPQQPWIMNATLKDNILFFSECDEERLSDAIRVSQMETDLELLGGGLQTEIGEKGINLSGGQKARVNLARAVYGDRDLYLLDDPLSALDAHVGEKVVDECILGALRNKTRVLATHQMHVVPKADHVIALDESGVAFSGDVASFMKTDVYRTMSMQQKSEESGGDEESEKEDSIANECDATDEKAEANGDKKVSKAKPKKKEPADATLMTVEEKASGGVPWSTYLEYFRFCGGLKMAGFVGGVFTLTEFLTVTSTVWLSMWATDRFELKPSTYLIVYIVLVLLGCGSAPIRFSAGFSFMRRGCINLHRTVLRGISIGTMEFFDTTPLGRIMNRFSRDIDVADNNLQQSLIQFMNCVMSILSSIIITLVSQPFVIVPLLLCGYLYYRLLVFYNSANREIRRTGSIAKSPLFSLLGEVLTGVSTISAYNRAPVVMQEALKRMDLVYSCSFLENVANRWLGVRIEFLSNVLVTCIALSGVIFTTTKYINLDIGLVSLSLTMALQTTSQLNWLVRQAANVEADMNSVERLIFYTTVAKEDMPTLDAEIDEVSRQVGLDSATGRGTDVTIVGSPASPVPPGSVRAGRLEFRDVQMRYREGLPLVLDHVNFVINAGEKVGIVGRTGSGKSTLLLTFMRMVDICGGEILVNGQAIRSLGLRDLRRHFSMIPQDPVLFDGTVRMNVDPFLQASSAEVLEALETVGLKERIASEPEGIDGRVLEGGSNFSVGQRQLLCMARALLKKGSGFILMDEATANIDQALDRHIQNTVMRAFAQYTVITIAHRLQTVARYDKIIVMDHGVVAEMGSPRALVSNTGSLFRRMVDSMGKKAAEDFKATVG